MLLIQDWALHLCPSWTFILAFIFVKKEPVNLYDFGEPVLEGLAMVKSKA